MPNSNPRFISDEHKIWLDPNGEPIAIVSIYIETIQNTWLLLPTVYIISTILGCLGEAQKRFSFTLYAYAFLPDRYEILIGVRDVSHRADIMEFFNSKLGCEVRRGINTWTGKVWKWRYKTSLVLCDEDFLYVFLRILGRGVTEDLVERPQDLSGVQCARALIGLERPKGVYLDRTKRRNLKRKKQRRGARKVKLSDAEVQHELVLTKLPCHRDMSDEKYARWVRDRCDEIAGTRALEREGGALGLKAMMRRGSRYEPGRDEVVVEKIGFVLLLHNETWQQRELAAYKRFAEAYWEAHERLRAGIAQFRFPQGGIPVGCRRPV